MDLRYKCKECGEITHFTSMKTVFRENGLVEIDPRTNQTAKCDHCGSENIEHLGKDKNKIVDYSGVQFGKVASMTNDQKKDYFKKRADKVARTKTAQDEKRYYKNNIISKGGRV